MSIVGTTYLERGEPVVVLVRWNGKGPRNVLIRRANGVKVVRPFRGLRRMPSDEASTVACARLGKSLGRNSALGEVRPSSDSREVNSDV